MSTTETEPRHGQKGEFVTYDNTDGNIHTRCTSYKRWCAKCREWVYGKGPVSMAMAAIACPKCSTRWENQ